MTNEDDAEDTNPQPVADNAADAKAIRKRALSAAQKHRQGTDWWRAALATETGRRELWGILADCHAFEERFACGPNGFPQAEATWFEAGKQSFGLRLYQSWLRIDRDAVSLMLDENDPRFVKKK